MPATNRAFKDWGKIFDIAGTHSEGGSTLATAIIDRLMHHGEALVTRGDSYRMKLRRHSLKDLVYGQGRARGAAVFFFLPDHVESCC